MLDEQSKVSRGWKVLQDKFLKKMGNGMNKILPGLYVGNFRDAKDLRQLEENNITHILSIHDNAKKILKDKEYLCIEASDSPEQDLTRFFPQVNKFIHKARLEGGAVLVHCLAGVSRSVTVTAAYIMTVTELGWRDALNSVRGARSVANPNFGFQKQLQNYDTEQVVEERKRFKRMYPDNPFNDEEECRYNMHCYQQFIVTGSIPARSDYPLPYKAYQVKNGNCETPTDEDKEKGCSAYYVMFPPEKRSKHKDKTKSDKNASKEEPEDNKNNETSVVTQSTSASTPTTTCDNEEEKNKKRHSALLDDL